MRILYLHQYFATPAMSGGTRSYEMARRLVAAGHRVDMVTSDRRPGAARGWRTEEIAGITVHWFGVPYRNDMGFAARVKAFVAYALAASMHILRLRCDVVFATSTPLTIAIPALIARARHRVPLVFEVRDLWPEMPIAVGSLRNPVLIALAHGLERAAYRGSARVVALSPGMAEGVVRVGYPAERVVEIPNSCDTALFDVVPDAGAAFRAEHPGLGDGPVVVYCGTLGRLNAVGYLAAVAGEMSAIDPDVRFLVVGDGADEEAIRERARECGVLDRTFFMMSSRPKQEIPRILSAAAVCTSLFAPVPEMENNSANKFFDALAAGRPVAINYGGWQASIVEEESIGVVLDPLDPRAAAESLNAFLASSDRVERARANARRLARERFGRDELAVLLERVLSEAVAQR